MAINCRHRDEFRCLHELNNVSSCPLQCTLSSNTGLLNTESNSGEDMILAPVNGKITGYCKGAQSCVTGNGRVKCTKKGSEVFDGAVKELGKWPLLLLPFVEHCPFWCDS